MKVQAAWTKANFQVHILPGTCVLVFSSEICEIFKNTFENTNNSVEDLRTGTCVECYLKIVDFVIISYIVI